MVGTIVGTHAFRIYDAEMGLRLPLDALAQTDDWHPVQGFRTRPSQRALHRRRALGPAT